MTDPASDEPRRSAEHSLSPEQQLELIDRVKSLESELAQVIVTRAVTPTEQLDAELRVVELRTSLQWRVGRIVTIPVRVVERRILRRRSR